MIASIPPKHSIPKPSDLAGPPADRMGAGIVKNLLLRVLGETPEPKREDRAASASEQATAPS